MIYIDVQLTVRPPSPKGKLDERLSLAATLPPLELLLPLVVVLPVDGVEETDEAADTLGAGVEVLDLDREVRTCGRAIIDDMIFDR